MPNGKYLFFKIYSRSCKPLPAFILQLTLRLIHNAMPEWDSFGKLSGKDIILPVYRTIVQISTPQKSQTHGNTNPVFNTREKVFPTSMPSILPKTAPIKLMMMDSYKNCKRMLCFLSPDGFNQSDFLGPFRYRHQHDIHQSDGRTDQGNESDDQRTHGDQGQV